MFEPTPPGRRSLLAALALLACALALPGTAQAGVVTERIKASGAVKVCIWPDHHGITWRNPRSLQLTGVGIELSAELARDLGAKLQCVASSFPRLIDNMLGDRCDIARHAVAVLPARADKQ